MPRQGVMRRLVQLCNDLCTGVECSCDCRNEPHRYGAMRIMLFCESCGRVTNEEEMKA